MSKLIVSRPLLMRRILAVSLSAALGLQGCGGGGGAAQPETASATDAATQDAEAVAVLSGKSATVEEELARLRSLGFEAIATTGGEPDDVATAEPVQLVEIEDPASATLATEGRSFALSANRVQPLVVGGSAAKLGQFPWAVFLSVPGGSCTATVIAPQWILSAAHCMPTGTTSAVGIVAQIGYVGPTPDFERIPGDYFVKLNNDMALVHLSTATKYAAVAYNGDPANDPGGVLRQIGFGRTSYTGPAGEFKYVDNDVVVQEASRPGFLTVGVDGSMQTICFGDSGGPNVKYDAQGQPSIIGVTSATFAPYCTGKSLIGEVSSVAVNIEQATGVPAGQHAGTNQAPTFAQVPAQETGMVATDVQFTATDPEGNPIVYTAVGLPAGLSMRYDTGHVTGTPTAFSYGTPSIVKITATDSTTGAARSATFTWRINTLGNADPVFDSIPTTTSRAGSPVSVAATASDPNGDAVTYSATGLPPGVSINPTSGLLSGTPTQGGLFQTNVRATDGKGGMAMETFGWEVTNAAPTIGAIADKVTAIGAMNTGFVISASDPEGFPVTMALTGLPYGVTFAPTTRTIGGIPSRAGLYVVSVKASDPFGGVATTNFTWAVSADNNRPPTMTQLSDMTTLPGVPVLIPIAASDPDGQKVTISFANLPTGVVFNATKMALVGTPMKGGAFVVAYSVYDAFGGKTTYPSFTWTIPNGAPVLTAPASATVMPGVVASIPFTLSDPDGNTMTLAATGLPRGMVVNALSKVVTGAPLVAGTFDVTMVATDKFGAKSGVATFTITVPDQAPVVGSQVASRTSVIGTAQTMVLDVADPEGHPLVITVSPGKLPPGLLINPVTKTISGKPSTAGTYSVTLVVADKYGASTTMQQFTWTITNQQPTIVGLTDQSSARGQVVSLAIPATDPDGNAVVVSAIGLPTGLKVVANKVTGAVTGPVGTYLVIFSVKDSYGMTAAAPTKIYWTVTP